MGRSLGRLLTTRLANLLVRTLLRLPVRDCTSGFRCYRREVLEAIDLDRLTSRGPSLVEETLYAAHLLGFRAAEVPIRFEERGGGESKVSLAILLDTLLQVIRFRLSLTREKVARAPPSGGAGVRPS